MKFRETALKEQNPRAITNFTSVQKIKVVEIVNDTTSQHSLLLLQVAHLIAMPHVTFKSQWTRQSLNLALAC